MIKCKGKSINQTHRCSRNLHHPYTFHATSATDEILISTGGQVIVTPGWWTDDQSLQSLAPAWMMSHPIWKDFSALPGGYICFGRRYDSKSTRSRATSIAAEVVNHTIMGIGLVNLGSIRFWKVWRYKVVRFFWPAHPDTLIQKCLDLPRFHQGSMDCYLTQPASPSRRCTLPLLIVNTV